jgi:hypothetical protein
MANQVPSLELKMALKSYARSNPVLSHVSPASVVRTTAPGHPTAKHFF